MAKSSKKKIIVALSGGVDSAVAAALLKKRGFEVVGVFFLFFGNPPQSSFRKGGGKRTAARNNDLINAKRIAKKIDIPLKVVDARQEFKKKIIGYSIESYKKGITPNPCVVCNKEMKFNFLFDLMKKYKADFVATGHYARIESVIASPSKGWINSAKQSRAYQNLSGLLRRCASRNDKFILLEAKDKTKDQSYFLYRLTRKELAKIIFPLGNYKKNEVKKMAKKFGLPVASEESQDICFLANSDIDLFLRKWVKPKPGNIVDEEGNILARHKGLPFYTLGQRKGIEIGGTGPYFVVRKNLRKNDLVISNDPKRLLVKKFFVSSPNWIKKGVKLPMNVRVQVRYHAPKVSAIIRAGKSGKLTIELKKTLRAVTPGQSAVFYKSEELLGGGIIL